MMNKFKVTKDNIEPEMMKVWRIVKDGVLSAPVEVLVEPESQNGEQMKRYRAMCGDIAKQAYDEDGNQYDSDSWFAVLFDAFEQERINEDKPLWRPRSIRRSIDGQRWVSARSSSANLRKTEAGEFIEFLFMFGAENKVAWSDPETVSLMHAER